MSALNSIGARALLANQLALQTAGNNTANVNTVGYSRQSVLLQNVAGEFSGSGYYGNGVEAVTVLRNHSEFLTRQAAVTGSVSASDSKRLQQLNQLEALFPGGKNGLGAAVGDLLNSFSDVASSPTDLSARTVVLSRADALAAQFRTAASGLAALQQGGKDELNLIVVNINSLATRIAKANEQIAQQLGSGHEPNDLLDQRDQLIKELNAQVQTTNIRADDGTVGIFVGGSQPLVLGKTVGPLAIAANEFGDPAKSTVTMVRGGVVTTLNETTLGGGALSGLLQFQNKDLVETSNSLGRLALALGTTMNEQQHLGLDLSGTAGSDLFALGPILGALPTVLPAAGNTGTATVQASVQTTPLSGATLLAPSDYEMTFTGAGSGTIKRLTDGQLTAFGAVPALVDGLSLQVSAGAVAGDRFLVTPFRQVAASMDTSFSSPKALAMASPVAATAGAANQGSLTLQNLMPQQANVNMGQTVTLTFTGAGTFNVVGTGTGNPLAVAYTPGQPISYNGWTLTLKGTAQTGDTYTVAANAFPTTNGGNAEAMMGIRDVAMFDGAATTEGYAALLSQVGVRVQNADFAADVSRAIAASAESDRSSVSGVNLDEEAAKLLQFQQAYQASAKILQISQSIFQTMIQSLGN